MGSSCRKFLDITQKPYINKEIPQAIGLHSSLSFTIEFYSGVGELRGTFGALVGNLLVMFGLDCEGDLLRIIPLEEQE